MLIGVIDSRRYVSLYLAAVDDEDYLAERYASRLGKVSCGKSCIRFKRPDDVDLGVLEEAPRRTAALGPSAAA